MKWTLIKNKAIYYDILPAFLNNGTGFCIVKKDKHQSNAYKYVIVINLRSYKISGNSIIQILSDSFLLELS